MFYEWHWLTLRKSSLEASTELISTRTKLQCLIPLEEASQMSPQHGLTHTHSAYKAPLASSFAPAATNFPVCKFTADAHHRRSRTCWQHQEDMELWGKLSPKHGKEHRSRGQGYEDWAIYNMGIPTFANKWAFCMVLLIRTSLTGTQRKPQHPPCPRKAGGQKARGAGAEPCWEFLSVAGCPHPICSKTYFTRSPRVGNFLLGRNRTTAFHCQQACIFLRDF